LPSEQGIIARNPFSGVLVLRALSDLLSLFTIPARMSTKWYRFFTG
jgi:hypothetical protein